MPKEKKKEPKLKDAATEHEEAEDLTKAVEFAQDVAEAERQEGVLAMQLASKASQVADREIMDAIKQSKKIQSLKEQGASENQIEKAKEELRKEFEEGVVASTVAEFLEEEAIEQMSEAFIAEAILETLMEISVEETEQALAATLKDKMKTKKAKDAPPAPDV